MRECRDVFTLEKLWDANQVPIRVWLWLWMWRRGCRPAIVEVAMFEVWFNFALEIVDTHQPHYVRNRATPKIHASTRFERNIILLATYAGQM